MTDRVSTEILANGAIRYGIYDSGGNLLRYEYIKPEDAPTQQGDALNKANLLSDATCAKLGLPTTAVPNDATNKIADKLDDRAASIGDILTTVRTDLGNKWLLCNGDTVDASIYPGLNALLSSKDVTDDWGYGSESSVSGEKVVAPMRYCNGTYLIGVSTGANGAYPVLLHSTDLTTWTRIIIQTYIRGGSSYSAANLVIKDIIWFKNKWIMVAYDNGTSAFHTAHFFYNTSLQASSWTHIAETGYLGEVTAITAFASDGNTITCAAKLYDNYGDVSKLRLHYIYDNAGTLTAGNTTLRSSDYTRPKYVNYVNGYWTVIDNDSSNGCTIFYNSSAKPYQGTWSLKRVGAASTPLSNVKYADGKYFFVYGGKPAYSASLSGTWTVNQNVLASLQDIFCRDSMWEGFGSTADAYKNKIYRSVSISGASWTEIPITTEATTSEVVNYVTLTEIGMYIGQCAPTPEFYCLDTYCKQLPNLPAVGAYSYIKALN